jgi:hypothetical protein
MTHPITLIYPMTQTSFSDAEFASKKRLTRRERFLAEIETQVCVFPTPCRHPIARHSTINLEIHAYC